MTDLRRAAPEAAYFLGGAALLASAFVHWISRGSGSGLRGHQLIDAAIGLGRHVPALSAAKLTVLWYIIPALGAASWIALGISGVTTRTARIVAGVALLNVLLIIGAFARLVTFTRLGPGPFVALSGAVALVLASWLPCVKMTTRARSSVVRAGDS
jgi:hypothetical protein